MGCPEPATGRARAALPGEGWAARSPPPTRLPAGSLCRERSLCFTAVHDLTSTAGIVAIAAGAVAVISLIFSIVLAVRLRRVRADQRAVLGDGKQDLVSHAAELHAQFEALSQYVEDAAHGLNHRVDTAEQRLDGALAYRSLVRYDAYGEMSGRQSTSIALLDAPPLRRRPLLDPPSRHGAPVRQAGARGSRRARALARGG